MWSDANFNAFGRSSSGALILCGRFPAVTCQFSTDHGYSWRAYTVDLNAGWCQGSVVEVEKDLMLWVYGAWGQGEAVPAALAADAGGGRRAGARAARRSLSFLCRCCVY